MQSITALRYAAAPNRTVQDLVHDRDAADRLAAWGQREMFAGSVVQKAGKVSLAAGLTATGLSLLGAPLPLGMGLGLVVLGPVMRGTGAWMTFQGLARMDKASVRSLGLSQQIAAQQPPVSAPASTSS